MSKDGHAPSHQAVQPRQTPSAGSSSTLSESVTSTSLSASATISTYQTSQAFVLTLTDSIDFGGQACTAALPAGGIIPFNDTYTLYLQSAVSFIALCGNNSVFNNNGSDYDNKTLVSEGTPFYASMPPQIFALATATVISYILVILIFITPRTFYVGGPTSTSGIAGSGTGLRTFFPSSRRRNSGVIGIGRRPLLQKIATLTVAVSLTLATADTFRVAERQFQAGYCASQGLVDEVVDGKEIGITRVISDTFLWLAQVQTLIRLFPRHKEKVTIKWLGFGLVLCDTVFSILEEFVSHGHRTRPGSFTDAIPALSYLFELSIGLIYASCVLYYALSKRRFAFWHPKMRNICLVALLSIIAVLIPVVFFITDLAQPDIAAWGEYIRWVGGAAASVVVWEWVERIESLERDEKKDGILGREIFDGDEMLDLTPSEDGFDQSRPKGSSEGTPTKNSKFWKNVRDLNIDIQPKIPLRKWKKVKPRKREDKTVSVIDATLKSDPQQITRPLQAITPISRSDTNSAASTVYAVRYHDHFSPSPAIPEDRAVEGRRQSVPINVLPAISDESTLSHSTSTSTTIDSRKVSQQADKTPEMSKGRQLWQGVGNPFKRKRTEPPAEVAAQITESNNRRSPIDVHLNLRTRLNAFTSGRQVKINGRSRKNKTPLAVTVIPAQPRASRANIEANENETEPEATSGADTGTKDPATTSTNLANDSSAPESDFGSPNLATLPVTIIPAPVRGGRTWSPDDMAHQEQTTPPAQEHSTSYLQNIERPDNQVPGVQEYPPPVLTQRGTLTISDSPVRFWDGHTFSNSITTTTRRSPRNNRSSTLTSINDRLDSASPATTPGVSGPRSTTADSSGFSPSVTNNGSGQQRLE